MTSIHRTPVFRRAHRSVLVIVVTALVAVVGVAAAATTADAKSADEPFADVSADRTSPAFSPFAKDIAWLAASDITTGYPQDDGTVLYQPTGTVARNAMAAFLYRAAGSPAYIPPVTSPFVDVAVDDAFYPEIAWLAAQGISRGWDMPEGLEFRPLADITRDAMATFLYRAAGSPTVVLPALSPFTDVSTRHPFFREMAWLASTGVSTGWRTPSGAQFRPGLAITRDAMAAFLHRRLVPSVIVTSASGRVIGDDYPSDLRSAARDALVDPWRFYNRECTSFVAWRINSANQVPFGNFMAGPNGLSGAFGNATTWAANATKIGYAVTSQPAVGSIAWWKFGHVAWVAKVNGDGTVVIEEYNVGKDGAYHSRTVKASSIDGFIHIRDL